MFCVFLRQRIDLHEDLLRVAFDRFDTDMSGFIEVSEIAAVIGCEGLDEVVPEEIIKIAGTNSKQNKLSKMHDQKTILWKNVLYFEQIFQFFCCYIYSCNIEM